jgi:hypothetical protein
MSPGNRIKVRIGDQVFGECGEGRVIAMTPEWCVYRDDRPSRLSPEGREYAELWEGITLVPETPKEVVTPLTEKEIDAE